MDYGLAKHVLMGAGELYSETSDHRKIFTPFKLAKEILDQMELKGNILTFNMEFIFVLKERGLINNVWFATVCDMQERAMIAVGIDKSRIIRYAYNKLDEFPEMKFDVVIANPPYENYKWKKFIRLGISLTKKGGWISMITPRWSMISDKKVRHLIFSMTNVKIISHLTRNTFKVIKKGGNIDDVLLLTNYFISQVGEGTASTIIKRQWAGKNYSTNVDINNTKSVIPAYLGDRGIELINKFSKLKKANIILEKTRSKMNIPAVYGCERHRAPLYGYAISLDSKLFSGIILDENGKKGNPDRNKQESVVWYCETSDHAINTEIWLNSRAIKMYLSQIDGSSHVRTLKHLYPDCPITDRIATEQEMYKAAGFSDELIQWINEQ